MTQDEPQHDPQPIEATAAHDVDAGPLLADRRPAWCARPSLPLVLAVVMGAPTLAGGFLTGDDIQLIRDHVLVNHPSIHHLFELFIIAHRDLYQPIPLASFAWDFTVLRWLGLSPDADGPAAGAWVFHLTNVLVHGLNAVLVWWLVRRVTGSVVGALIAGSLFAVHPLNVECVAWLSGRIMMLSATFTLASLIVAVRAFDRPGRSALVGAPLFAALAMMSKINVALPILCLLIPFLRRRWPSRRWWAMFAAVTVVTAALVLVNVRLSWGQLDAATEGLGGSRWARTVIAVGWYLSRYVCPIGLAPWHPTEPIVTSADPQFLPGLAASVVFAALAGALLRRSRVSTAGVIWFLVVLAPTLPLIPARNLAVAERYVYLPAIGFHLIVASGCAHLLARQGRGRVRTGAAVLFAGALVVLTGVSWKAAGFYRDNVNRCRRTAELYPDHSGVWTRVAWAYYDAGAYDKALRTAERELDHHPIEAQGDVRQVQAMALLRSGATDEAVARLEAALAFDPADGMAHARLATALAEAERLEDAAHHYRRAVEIMPGYNPGIVGLAQICRKLGRADEAAAAFAKALANNPYNPLATTALAEIDLLAGHVAPAAERLERLLAWMPENAVAHANLGVCRARLGDANGAMTEYRAALALDPVLVPPRLSLALLLAEQGAAEQAEREFRQAAAHSDYGDPEVLVPYSEFLISRGGLRDAASIWTEALRRRPNDRVMASWYAWVCVHAGQWEVARQTWAGLAEFSVVSSQSSVVGSRSSAISPQLSAVGSEASAQVVATLVGIMLDVHAGRPAPAEERTAELCAADSAEARDGRARLQRALKAYSGRHPASPWPYYLMILLFRTDGPPEGAALAADAFEQVCPDPEWAQRARRLLTEPSPSP